MSSTLIGRLCSTKIDELATGIRLATLGLVGSLSCIGLSDTIGGCYRLFGRLYGRSRYNLLRLGSLSCLDWGSLRIGDSFGGWLLDDCNRLLRCCFSSGRLSLSDWSCFTYMI